jgi:subtilisin family serine protease
MFLRTHKTILSFILFFPFFLLISSKRDNGFLVFLKDYDATLYPGFRLTDKSDDRVGIVNYYNALSIHMESFVSDLLKDVEYEIFWIAPVIYTKTFPILLQNHHLVDKIVPNTEIARIVPGIFEPEEMVSENTNWGLDKMNVMKAWEISDGSGITVASIDTGVMYTHESIVSSYGGSLDSHDYTWFDPKEFRNDDWWCTPGICSPIFCCMNEPFDNNGHGTHTIGTIAGSKNSGIGVAPGVRWIAAKGCRDGGCLAYGLCNNIYI